MSERTLILDHDRVQAKLQRIAHQLHEELHSERSIVVVGIAPRGTHLAERLGATLREISGMEVNVVSLELDKNGALDQPVKLAADTGILKDRVVVLVDDVIMSGRTLMHAAAHLVRAPIKRMTTVVLVDRQHRAYPIRADIVGLTLSTTMQEHISVELGKRDAVYLS